VKDVIIVETVAVDQAEVEVATATDPTLVVLAPGWGDYVQVAKAGILEIADVFVVNKADKEGADDAVRELKNMLRMGPKMEWTPPIVKTSTVTGEGVDDLWEAIQGHRRHQEGTGGLEERRRRRIVEEVKSMVAFQLRERTSDLLVGEDEQLIKELGERRIDPYAAASSLVDAIVRSSGAGREP